MGEAKERGTYKERVQQAKRRLAENIKQRPSQLNYHSDTKSINAESEHTQLHTILFDIYDKHPERCFDLIGGGVMAIEPNLDFVYLNESKGSNTYIPVAEAIDPENNQEIFKVGDFFWNVKGTDIEEARYLLSSYKQDWENGMTVLKPGISMDKKNGKPTIEMIMSYVCKYKEKSLGLVIGLIETKSGVVKTEISICSMPLSALQLWDSPGTGAVSF